MKGKLGREHADGSSTKPLAVWLNQPFKGGSCTVYWLYNRKLQ